jgi:hypothetical protein
MSINITFGEGLLARISQINVNKEFVTSYK